MTFTTIKKNFKAHKKRTQCWKRSQEDNKLSGSSQPGPCSFQRAVPLRPCRGPTPMGTAVSRTCQGPAEPSECRREEPCSAILMGSGHLRQDGSKFPRLGVARPASTNAQEEDTDGLESDHRSEPCVWGLAHLSFKTSEDFCPHS